MKYKQVLIKHLNLLHTTEGGYKRISKNLDIKEGDTLNYCRELILDENSVVYKQGKNYYCEKDGVVLTINSMNYSIITAHRM